MEQLRKRRISIFPADDHLTIENSLNYIQVIDKKKCARSFEKVCDQMMKKIICNLNSWCTPELYCHDRCQNPSYDLYFCHSLL